MNPDLFADKQTVETILNADYWRQIGGRLIIEDELQVKKFQDEKVNGNNQSQNLWDKKIISNAQERLTQDGFTKIDADAMVWTENEEVCFDRIVTSIKTLMEYDWPPSFLLVYDDVWRLIMHAQKLMSSVTGNRCNFDILAWYVDPNKGDVGFAPHRDRQPDDAKSTFRKDRTPKYSTCWIPFTDACPDNSCLHFIPAQSDPGYMDGDLEGEDDPDPLERSLPNKEAFQNIKAAPVKAKGALIFTHRVIHWGSKGRQGYETPRISMSFGCSDDEFEQAYLERRHLPFPPLHLRVALVCAQMISYYQRFPPSTQQLQLYYQVFDRFKQDFAVEYRTQVIQEYVKACGEVNCEEQADHMLDGALEQMLQTGGDGYQDDFDGLDGEDVELNVVEGDVSDEDEDEEDIAALGLNEEELQELMGRPTKKAKKQ